MVVFLSYYYTIMLTHTHGYGYYAEEANDTHASCNESSPVAPVRKKEALLRLRIDYRQCIHAHLARQYSRPPLVNWIPR